MQRPLFIAPADKTFMIPERAWMKIAVYKVFWPPETEMKLGKHVVKLQDLYPWPPPVQESLLTIDEVPVKKNNRSSKSLA